MGMPASAGESSWRAPPGLGWDPDVTRVSWDTAPRDTHPFLRAPSRAGGEDSDIPKAGSHVQMGGGRRVAGRSPGPRGLQAWGQSLCAPRGGAEGASPILPARHTGLSGALAVLMACSRAGGSEAGSGRVFAEGPRGKRGGPHSRAWAPRWGWRLTAL